MRLGRLPLALVAVLASSPGAAQETGGGLLSTADGRLRLKGELKLNYRDSASLDVPVALASGGTVHERTPSPGSSLELSTVNLVVEADLSSLVSAKVEVHLLDLYNRNPTSSDDRLQLREAWVRFGKRYDGLRLPEGTTFYVEAGKLPRFSKQQTRRLESYGLWGTAVGRFEEVGLEAGGSLGRNVYWRSQLASGNPLFMRDPNALAGDNGTEERRPDSTTPTVYESGFPILYDAKATDVSLGGRLQVGAGLGTRLASADGRRGVDVMAWLFRRTLVDRVPIRGSYYGGDVDLLDGIPPTSIPLDGRDKTEVGVNVEARWEGLSVFGQWVRQDIAGLVRKGVEVEAAYRIRLPGLFVLGDTPFGNWLQPAVRYSVIDNQFGTPAGFPAPSLAWDWSKLDLGVRLGLVRGVDLTAEYTRSTMTTKGGDLHPDELLVTLRAGF